MPSLGIIEEISLNSIQPSPYNSRAYSGRVEELLISIDNMGLIQPLVVRPVKKGFEIVAGNRRLEACRRLGWRKVSCHVVELNDREAFEVSLVENIQRRTLHPLEEAEAFRKYVTEYGWGGVSELAHRIGKSQEYVSKRMRLLTLPKGIRDELTTGRLNPSVAEELLSLDDDELQLELGHMASSNHLTMKEVRSLVRILKKDGEDDILEYEASSGLFTHDQGRKYVDKALRRVIVVLRTALLRLDEIIEDLDDRWVIQELLMEYRLSLHDQISLFIKARRRLDRIFGQKPLEVIERVSRSG